MNVNIINEVSCPIDTETDLIIKGARDKDLTFMHESMGAFNITKAVAWARTHVEPSEVHLDVPDTLAILAQRDLDPHRLNELWRRYQQGDKTVLAQPVLYIAWDDGTYLLVDGAHRLMLMCWIESIKFYNAWIIPFELHGHFLVRYYYRRAGRETEVPAGTLLQFQLGVFTAPGRFPERRQAARDWSPS